MTDYPFPFIGAGEAGYFEWAEVFVRFKRLPTSAQRKKIEKAVPVPLQDTVEWRGPMLWLASTQGAGRHIKAAYSKSKKAGKASKLSSTSKFAQAGSSADSRFNAHIESFFHYSHRLSPILFAFRREDHEAGGTQLSDWHKESIQQTQFLVDEMSKSPGEADPGVAKSLISWARRSKVAIDEDFPSSLARAEKLAEEARQKAREQEDRDRYKKAAVLLKRKSLKGKTITAKALRKNLPSLAKHLPKTAKRLGRLKDGEFKLLRGASATAIKACGKKMGISLHPAHAALLKAFDGGTIGELTFLGTEIGGSRGKDEICDFTNACFGHYRNTTSVVVVRSSLDRFVCTEPKRAPILKGDPGARSYMLEKDCKTLDTALDLVLKNKRCTRKPAG